VRTVSSSSSSSSAAAAAASERRVILRRGSVSGVACVAVADGACDALSLLSLRPVVHHAQTRFVRTVETVLKSSDQDTRPRGPVADLPACRTTAMSWYRTTSAPKALNGRTLNCVTANQLLAASARIIVECETTVRLFIIRPKNYKIKLSFTKRCVIHTTV